ncbi:MAG: cyclodeaminase/cyclohydrolase family protein [Phycisphaerae bacterium]|nr:cyclodeaminase/cyclohydrolase family protein [Phycisphaerae bacterium]
MSAKQDVLSMSARDFAAAAAAKTPTPGGGSVAGVVGALAVALGEMALNFSRGKKKLAEHEEYYAHLSGRLEKARSMFYDLVDDDIAAYQLYQQANRRADGPEKEQAVQLATAAAINVPRQATKLALALLDDIRELSAKCNTWLITDLLASAALAVATVTLSDYNVRINIPSVTDKAAGRDIKQSSADDLKCAKRIHAEIEEAAKQYLL